MKTDPYKAHVEFAALLNDLVADVPNPSRAQPTWKVLAREYLSQREEYYSNDSETLKSYHQISVANGIFVQSGDTISEDYKQAVENIYKSDFKELNFKGDPAGSARTINTYVL